MYARLRDPEFKAKYDEARRNLLEQATTALQSNLSGAVDTIATIMENENASHQVRLNAAESVIRNALKLTETVDILERLGTLERTLNDNDT